jgi:hypothetical protein
VTASKEQDKLDMVVTPVIPAFRRLRQEDHKFENSLGYIVRL